MSRQQPIVIPKHSPWVSQFLVIRALLRRESTTRFGKYRLGFVWMLLEPLLGVLMIGVVLGAFLGRTVPDIPYAFFILNGMILLKLFTSSMNTAIRAIETNKGLLVYPNVKLLDPFIARFLFELITSSFAFGVFCVIGMAIDIEIDLGHLDVLACSFLITWLGGCGVGLIAAVASAYHEDASQILSVIQRPLIFISAVLHPFATYPLGAREWLQYNPLIHTIEHSRHALFPFYSVGETSLLYPSQFAAVVLATGLVMFHNHRKFLSKC